MRHVVFDIDGTLINTAMANLCSLRAAVLHYTGKDYSHEELTFSLGRSAVDTMQILGVDPSLYEAVVVMWEASLQDYADTIHYFPGIPQVVKKLHEMGYPMGIVTSQSRAEFASFAILDELRPYFGVVINAEDTEKHKPNPDPLLKYAELAGVDISEVTYIGDSPYDKACAVSAGAKFILAPWGSSQPVDVPDEWRAGEPADIPGMIEV